MRRARLGSFLLLSLMVGCSTDIKTQPTTRGEASTAVATPTTSAAPSTPVAARQARGAPLFNNLGNYHHPITTRSPEAQRYFDQGLTLTYAFNHPEAIRSYTEAARLDPQCAMAWWGVALSYGPNINKPMDPADAPKAWEAIQKAKALSKNASPQEQAYIAALSKRYAQDPPADRSPLDKAYADAMRELHRNYADDLDAATLFAESV